MRFRPCIDIHNGQVKQIVGGSLIDDGDQAVENYISSQDAAYYAELYKKYQLAGGHIILLNNKESIHYEETRQQALKALKAYCGNLQIGGGITPDNAQVFLNAGASHVIVTSYVFKNGQIYMERIKEMCRLVGREHLVLDLSCRKKEDEYYVVTDRWQRFTNVIVEEDLLKELSRYCSEFLIHAVDVEGKSAGIEEALVKRISRCNENPITYAGGVGSIEDIRRFKALTNGEMDITIGSALDLFGGSIDFKRVLELCEN
jgi:phosphoribosylformimino-5-aminoimidazole carboxamide ribotide isomerase